MATKTLIGFAVPVMVLTGCTAADVRGRPAANAAECRADFETEMQSARRGSVTGNSLASAIFGAFVSAAATNVAQDNAQQRYRACLQRVGAMSTPVGEVSGGLAPSRQSPAPAQQLRSATCPANASVLYGGTQYCMGR